MGQVKDFAKSSSGLSLSQMNENPGPRKTEVQARRSEEHNFL